MRITHFLACRAAYLALHHALDTGRETLRALYLNQNHVYCYMEFDLLFWCMTVNIPRCKIALAGSQAI